MTAEDIVFAVLCFGFAILCVYFLMVVRKERAKALQNKK